MLHKNLINLIAINRTLCSSSASKIKWNKLKYKSKVPEHPVRSSFSEKTEKIKITEEEIKLLEKLSLVDLERT